jgi:hypothetical protein
MMTKELVEILQQSSCRFNLLHPLNKKVVRKFGQVLTPYIIFLHATIVTLYWTH